MFPIQEMRNPAGDTMFKTFMSMATSYNTPIDDPLFAAHKEMIEYDDIQRKNFTIYHADYPMRAVGCLQQVSKPNISFDEINFDEIAASILSHPQRPRRLLHTVRRKTVLRKHDYHFP